MKNWQIVLTTVLIGVIATQAQALDPVFWVGGTGNWSTGANWYNGATQNYGEPGSDDVAFINNTGTAEITQAGEVCFFLFLGENAEESGSVELSGTGQLSTTAEFIGNYGTGSFTQTGGTNTLTSDLILGYYSGSNGTYDLSGGQLSAYSELIGAIGGTGNFTQTGGTHTVDWNVNVGALTGSDGTYTISGGTLDVDGHFYVAPHGTGQFTVTGDDPLIDLGRFIQDSNGTLNSQIDADGIATIDVSDTGGLGGIWNVVDLGSAPLGTFDILRASGGIFGTFDTINLPNANWSWGISSNGTETLWVQHVPEPAIVDIDIRPGSDQNPVNLRSNGVLSVAILGGDEFDVYEIDLSSLILDGATPRPRGNSENVGTFRDVNGDDLTDLLVYFGLAELDVDGSVTELLLEGALNNGTAFSGSDAISLIGPGIGNSSGVVLSDSGQTGPAVIPEPGTLAVLLLGGLALLRRRL